MKRNSVNDSLSKVTIAVIALILVAFGGLVAYALHHKKEEESKILDVSNVNSGVIIEGEERNGFIADHVRGKADSKIVVVEYADYQCPGFHGPTPRQDLRRIQR